MKTESVDILLATYQGNLYLSEQLDSILAQTYPHIQLWIRDDVSIDGTKEIVKNFQAKNPDRITVIQSDIRLGIKGNFSTLLGRSRGPYIMFADQDDIWMPNKVEKTIKAMKLMENVYGSHSPLLVHTDLIVSDRNLETISPSFWKYSRLNPSLTALNRLLVQNVVTGCTMMFNRPLLELSNPIPPESMMHDWWIALVASAFGHIQPINEPTIYYRQHGNNDTGAKELKFPLLLKELSSLMLLGDQHPSVKSRNGAKTQARTFLERYGKRMSDEQRQMVKTFSHLDDFSWFTKRKKLIEYHLFKQGLWRNLHTLFLNP